MYVAIFYSINQNLDINKMYELILFNRLIKANKSKILKLIKAKY